MPVGGRCALALRCAQVRLLRSTFKAVDEDMSWRCGGKVSMDVVPLLALKYNGHIHGISFYKRAVCSAD